MTLLRKLMEIYETKAEVLDEFEYSCELEGKGEFERVEFVGLTPFLITKQGDHHVVLDFHGKEILRVVGELRVENKDVHPFFVEYEPGAMIDLTKQKRVIYTLSGERVFVSETEIRYGAPGRKIAFYDSLRTNIWVPYDAHGDCCLEAGDSVQGHYVDRAEGVYVEVFDERIYKYQMLDPDGNKIGIPYDYNEPLTRAAKGNYVTGFALRGAEEYTFYVLHKNGSTKQVAAPRPAGMIAAIEDKIYIDFSDVENQNELVVVDGEGKELFRGGDVKGENKVLDIRHRFVAGDKMYFRTSVAVKETSQERFVLLDEHGKEVNPFPDQKNGFKNIQYLQAIGDIGYFLYEFVGEQKFAIVSSKGEVCAVSPEGVRVLGEANGEQYFAQKDENEYWQVVDKNGKQLTEAQFAFPKKVIGNGVDVFTLWEFQMKHQLTINNESPFISSDKFEEIGMFSDGLGRLYFFGKDMGMDAVVDREGRALTFPPFRFQGKVVSLKDRIIFLASDEDEQAYYLLDSGTLGFDQKRLDISGDIKGFEKFDEEHIVVVYQAGDELKKKIIKP